MMWNPTAIVPMEDDIVGIPEEIAKEESDSFSPDKEGSINGALTVYKPIRVTVEVSTRGIHLTQTQSRGSTRILLQLKILCCGTVRSSAEALLYSTYRYASQNLTYTVPVSTKGVWRVTMQWTEIAVFMRDGTQVFTVSFQV